jgi:hypothetical protein
MNTQQDPTLEEAERLPAPAWTLTVPLTGCLQRKQSRRMNSLVCGWRRLRDTGGQGVRIRAESKQKHFHSTTLQSGGPEGPIAPKVAPSMWIN